MNASATMTIRVPLDTKAKLARLAEGTRRSKSWLAAEAVAAYVDQELAIIDAIHRGEADIQAGRTTAHSDVMGGAARLIDEARTARK